MGCGRRNSARTAPQRAFTRCHRLIAPSVSDTAVGVTLLSRIAVAHQHITKAGADAGYRTTDASPATTRPTPTAPKP